MYPEDKIPDWLKISTWLEIEITECFAEYYENLTWKDYEKVAKEFLKNNERK